MNRTILALACAALALSAQAQTPPADPQVGGRAASGNLIIHVFRGAENRVAIPAELTTEYGFMVLNVDWDHPKPLYRLASRAAGTIQEFDTLKEFYGALAKLPKGAELTEYNKCLVPTSYGLKFDWEDFKRTCKRLKIKLAQDAKRTCNCPAE
jgi:hypothetical protein